jgi:thioredoxin reductase
MTPSRDTDPCTRTSPRICVVGAGPCGITTIKNLRDHGLENVVCYDETEAIGGNWVFDERPERKSVYESTHLISSKRGSSFEHYPMPDDYPDYPSHRQMLAYFQNYACQFGILRHIQLRTRVEQARLCADGRWSVQIKGPTGASEEIFEYLIVCSGHHREPFIPSYPGTFSGQTLHSSQFKRPEPFRDKRVLVVGAGNSGCDIAFDVARVGRRSCLSARRGYYVMPKIALGRPVDVIYARLREWLPRAVANWIIEVGLKLTIGPWQKYGLQCPPCRPLEMHPTINSTLLGALRDGTILPRRGIERLDGDKVHFVDGTAEAFDTIVWATGFRINFPFLDSSVVDWDPDEGIPLYLKMMHRRIANLFFIGLFQPVGCIWRLADNQARIAALQIAGRLARPADIVSHVARDSAMAHRQFVKTPRHVIEVDYHLFARQLAREIGRTA